MLLIAGGLGQGYAHTFDLGSEDSAQRFRFRFPGYTLVAYDDRGGAMAARLWWLLRWLGHERVAVLDGGWPAWLAAGLPLRGGPETRAPRRFVPALRPALLAGVELVVASRFHNVLSALKLGKISVGPPYFNSIFTPLMLPFLLLIEPAFVPGPMLAAAFLLTLALTGRERRGVRVDDLKWSLGGRVLGIVAALWVLATVSPEHLTMLMGGLILVAVALSASGLHIAPAPTSLVGAGALSGFMSTTVSSGGPAIALLYQKESGGRVRGTLSAFFTVGTAMSIAGLYFIHRFGAREIALTGALLPGTAVGYLLSRRIASALDRGYMRASVLVLSAVAGAIVVVKDLL